MALLFVDTNVFLDFYRTRGSDPGMALLEKLRQNRDRVVTTGQVLDEFLRNRQAVLLRTVAELEKLTRDRPVVPSILMDMEEAQRLSENHKSRVRDLKALVKHLKVILKDPRKGDDVFFAVAELTHEESELCLSELHEEWSLLVEVARRRLELGLPPGKADAQSLGDAINWLWLTTCAERRRESAIIVSRDGDYGVQVDGSWIVNDRLVSEFKGLVGQRYSITLTDKLSTALEKLDVRVTQSERKAEQRLIDARRQLRNQLVHGSSARSQAELWKRVHDLFGAEVEAGDV